MIEGESVFLSHYPPNPINLKHMYKQAAVNELSKLCIHSYTHINTHTHTNLRGSDGKKEKSCQENERYENDITILYVWM